MRQVAQALDLDPESSRGVLVLLRAPADLDRVQPAARILREAGLNVLDVDADTARLIEPGLASDNELAGALHLPDGESGNCRLFAQMLRYAAQERGVQFLFQSRVEALQGRSGRRAAGRRTRRTPFRRGGGVRGRVGRRPAAGHRHRDAAGGAARLHPERPRARGHPRPAGHGDRPAAPHHRHPAGAAGAGGRRGGTGPRRRRAPCPHLADALQRGIGLVPRRCAVVIAAGTDLARRAAHASGRAAGGRRRRRARCVDQCRARRVRLGPWPAAAPARWPTWSPSGCRRRTCSPSACAGSDRRGAGHGAGHNGLPEGRPAACP